MKRPVSVLAAAVVLGLSTPAAFGVEVKLGQFVDVQASYNENFDGKWGLINPGPEIGEGGAWSVTTPKGADKKLRKCFDLGVTSCARSRATRPTASTPPPSTTGSSTR